MSRYNPEKTVKKLALALLALAMISISISPAFAWDRRHRDWREERHYRPYPYYRITAHIRRLLSPFPSPFPPFYTPYPNYPVYPTCQQVWVQPQWVWDVLSNQWVFDPGHWQIVCY